MKVSAKKSAAREALAYFEDVDVFRLFTCESCECEEHLKAIQACFSEWSWILLKLEKDTKEIDKIGTASLKLQGGKGRLFVSGVIRNYQIISVRGVASLGERKGIEACWSMLKLISSAKFWKLSAQVWSSRRGTPREVAFVGLQAESPSLEFSCYKESAKKHNKVQSGGQTQHPVEVVDDCPKEHSIYLKAVSTFRQVRCDDIRYILTFGEAS